MSGAKLVRKIVIQCKLKTQSPMRIGSGANDGLTDILILKDKQGRPFIPGTSLAGVLRSEIAAIYGEAAADKLFGSIDGCDANQSMLNVSDAVLFSEGIVVRDGVAIDELTGVAETGAKFDFEALERGAVGNVLLELTVRECDKDKQPSICYQHNTYSVKGDCYGELAATIADLLTGGISIGSLTTKGYGKIAGAEAVAVYDFDFAQAKSAEQWLAYISDEKLPQAAYTGKAEAAKAEKNFYLEVDCALRGALLVRNFDVDDVKVGSEGVKLSAVQLKSGEDYVIPGTSWKGVLRSRAFKILLALTGNDLQAAQRRLQEIFGFANDDDKQSGKRSRLLVEETYISSDKLYAMRQTRNRIDRFTGSTIEGALFCEEPVWQQKRDEKTITLKACLKNCNNKAEAGLMLLLLKDLWLGNMNIGSGKGIGRGVLRGVHCQIDYAGNTYTMENKNGFTLTGNKDELEACVQALVGELNG